MYNNSIHLLVQNLNISSALSSSRKGRKEFVIFCNGAELSVANLESHLVSVFFSLYII